MSTLSCEFCDKTFTNKTVLKTHQNTNKKCLAGRGLLLTTEYKCDACSIVCITSKVMEKHFEVCVKYIVLKYERELDKLKLHLSEVDGRCKKQSDDIIMYKERLKKLETLPSNEDFYQLKMENKFLEKQLQKRPSNEEFDQLKIDNKFLEKQLEKAEKQIEKLQEGASTQTQQIISTLLQKASDTSPPSTTNNSIRNLLSTTYTLDKLTPESIEEMFESKYSADMFMEGLEALGKHIATIFMKTPDHKLMMCCSDMSRKVCKYFDHLHNLREDDKVQNLCQVMKKPVCAVLGRLYKKCVEDLDKKYIDNDDTRFIEQQKLDSIYTDLFHFHENHNNNDFLTGFCSVISKNKI